MLLPCILAPKDLLGTATGVDEGWQDTFSLVNLHSSKRPIRSLHVGHTPSEHRFYRSGVKSPVHLLHVAPVVYLFFASTRVCFVKQFFSLETITEIPYHPTMNNNPLNE